MENKLSETICLTMIEDGKTSFCRWWNTSMPLLLLSQEKQGQHKGPIVAAKVDNRLEDLHFIPDRDSVIEMVDLSSEEGLRIYARSLALVFMKAARDVCPERSPMIQYSLNKGFYGEISGSDPLDKGQVSAIGRRMWELIRGSLPLKRRRVPKSEAIEILSQAGQKEQLEILRLRKQEPVNLYFLGDYTAFCDDVLVPHSGLLQAYQLEYKNPGFLVRIPDRTDPFFIPDDVEQKKLSFVFQESENWAKIMQIRDVVSLNKMMSDEKGFEMIRVAEALHEKKIAQIADLIYQNRENTRLILIAGPSSSGKTTFAQRLYIQLRVNGLQPVTVSLDDYFVPRELTPVDENGNKDFESLDAIDCQLFNQHLEQLIAGKEVEVPQYNFHTGLREYNGKTLRLSPGQPLIVEGIHGLNERLTMNIPRDKKFKIYISALAVLNLDPMNYVKTTDTRLIRRIVRDHQFRSHTAAETLRMWPQVRAGEERNIFPFQEEADVLFNSFLVYEHCVLMRYAVPLLESVSPQDPGYGEAQRLISLMDYFVPVGVQEIPMNSILREFIGQVCAPALAAN